MKVVAFSIADKEYAVQIEQIQEVIRKRKAVPVPDAAYFVEGVMNLRGKVVPLINLRKKFGFADDPSAGPANRIIVTEINGSVMGFVTDRVTDVITLEPGSIEPPSEVLKEAVYLSGVAKFGKRLFLLVNLEKLLSSEDKENIAVVHKRVEVRKKA